MSPVNLGSYQLGPPALSGLNPDDGYRVDLARQTDQYWYDHRNTFNSVSAVTGVPPTAIAASIGEEYRMRTFAKDGLFYPVWGGDILVNGRGGDQMLERNYATHAQALQAGQAIPGNYLDPTTFDIGPGHIKVATAMDMVKKYVNQYTQSDPLGLKQYVGHYDALYRDLLDPNSDVSVKIAGLKLKEVQDYYLKYAANWYQGLDGVSRDQALDSGYRSSPFAMNGEARDSENRPVQFPPHVPISRFEPLVRSHNYDYFRDPRSPYNNVGARLAGQPPPQ
jgi:hypothetical protein